MKFVLILLALSAASNIAAVKLCTFGEEAISDMYSRFDTFRKAKKLDTSSNSSLIDFIHHYRHGKDGGMASLETERFYLVDYYNFNNQNETVTMNGTFEVKDDGPIIKYERNSKGIVSFEDLKNGEKFQINNLDHENALLDDFMKDMGSSYRIAVGGFLIFRAAMYYFYRDFFLKDFEHISLLKFNPFRGGFRVQFVDNMDGNRLTVSVRYKNSETLSEPIINHQKIHGVFKCGTKSQRYYVLDGKVVVNGKPYGDGYI